MTSGRPASSVVYVLTIGWNLLSKYLPANTSFSDANPRRLIYKTDFSVRVSFHKERKRPPLGATKTVSQTTVIWDKALFVNEAEELLAQTQLRNQRTIALDVDALEVLQHAAALTDHQQQTTVGMMILRVGLEMLVQVVDARGQQSRSAPQGSQCRPRDGHIP